MMVLTSMVTMSPMLLGERPRSAAAERDASRAMERHVPGGAVARHGLYTLWGKGTPEAKEVGRLAPGLAAHEITGGSATSDAISTGGNVSETGGDISETVVAGHGADRTWDGASEHRVRDEQCKNC